jgi:hypothetical protein
VAASLPGRWNSGGRWHPGALVLTNRRIGFFPGAWAVEPWTLAPEELERIEAGPSPLARLAAIVSWPATLCITARTGDQDRFAVADPDEVLRWFTRDPRRGLAAPPQRIASQGAFDA